MSANATMEVQERTCCLCERTGRRSTMIAAAMVRPQVAAHIAQHYPDKWTGAGYLCRNCLNTERLDYVTARLTQEKGALSTVEEEVAKKAGLHLTIARNIDAQFQEGLTVGQAAADTVARIGGSWVFVIGFLVFLVLWMAFNTFVLRQTSFDPYPYILLNLVLSCIAALQAPIIMMSQNRQSERDRVESTHDYETDLKAEIEIASLHDKIDHLLHAQWERMVELQEMQIDLLTEIAGRPRRL
ncbi:MAG TPA: DUF1003 domain-containing protein [Candidatus Eisenbacteria bacterium]|nr:DUF1003 domain-containing protein [Candidatus Eisenbacteria bacterium]